MGRSRLLIALFLASLLLAVAAPSVVKAQFTSPVGTPLISLAGLTSLIPPQLHFYFPSAPNHWWLIDYWDGYNTYGRFTAVANTISGLGVNDAILVLPMNLAYGDAFNFEWFQFDLQFNPDGSVLMLIWSIPTCGYNPQYNPFEVDLPYTPNDNYTYQGSIVNGKFRFQVWDNSTASSWFMDFNVPSTARYNDASCFSPASALEGYTTVANVSSMPDFQAMLGYGITTYSSLSSGSVPPSGFTVTNTNLGGGLWQWGFVGTAVAVPEYSSVAVALIGGLMGAIVVCLRRKRVE